MTTNIRLDRYYSKPNETQSACDHDKVYNRRRVYTSHPPKMDWARRRCGLRGRDTLGGGEVDDEYSAELRKWAEDGVGDRDGTRTGGGGQCLVCGGPVGETGCFRVECLGQPFKPNGV